MSGGPTILNATAQTVYICFVAVQRPDKTWHWRQDLCFDGPKGYEMATGWDAAMERGRRRRHIVVAELPTP